MEVDNASLFLVVMLTECVSEFSVDNVWSKNRVTFTITSTCINLFENKTILLLQPEIVCELK